MDQHRETWNRLSTSGENLETHGACTCYTTNVFADKVKIAMIEETMNRGERIHFDFVTKPRKAQGITLVAFPINPRMLRQDRAEK
jgi:hypothetical protein